MKRLSYFILALGFSIFLSNKTALAVPVLNVTLSSKSIHLDESASLTIDISWPKSEAQYSFAFPDLRLKNLVIDRQGESLETFIRDDQEWKRKIFSLILKPSQVGEARVGAFTLPYIDPASQKGGDFKVDEQIIQISKPPFKWKPLYTWIALIVLAIPAAGAAGFFSARSKRAKMAALPNAESAKNNLLSRLQSLANPNPSIGQQEQMAELEVIFYQFLEEHFSINARQLSEGQMASELNRLNLSPDEIRTVQKFLEKIREVKYTGFVLSNSEWSYLVKEVTRFIEGKQVAGNPQT